MIDTDGKSGNVSTEIAFEGRVISLVIGDDGHFDVVVMCDHRDGNHDGFPMTKIVEGRINKDGTLYYKGMGEGRITRVT